MNSFEASGAVSITNADNSETTILFPVPSLPPNIQAPAVIQSIALIRKSGEEDVLRLVIKRDLSVPIESFTFRFRFSALPIYVPDSQHSFSEYKYTEDDVNSSELITFNGIVPEGLDISGSGAYICAVSLISGQSLEYEASEYKFVRRPRKQEPTDTSGINTAKQESQPAPKKRTASDRDAAPHEDASKSAEIQKKKRTRLTVILCALMMVLILEAIGGVFLYRYLGVRRSTDALMKEARYNEAYKIAENSGYDSLLQRVCEKASTHYFETGDLESAYIYAYGAPEQFTGMIIEYAAQSVVSVITGEINENAFRVAKMSENDQVFDVIIHSMIDVLGSGGDYPNALRVASELRNDDDRKATENKVFSDAIDYYSKTHRYGEAVAFIEELKNITTFERSKEESLDDAVARFAALGDNAAIIYFAHYYPDIDTSALSGMKVVPDDGGVRAELSVVYPMLDAEQKRIYHSKKIAVYNEEPLIIQDGKLTVGTRKLTDVISVDTNETSTLVLYNDGRAELLPNTNRKTSFTMPEVSNVIDIALGEKHAVLLHADGTVSVYGDNSYGQANVSEWTDIVAIAAGQRFTLGLKLGGTVVAVGENNAMQCSVAGCNNAVDIAAGDQTSVVQFSDGTVKLFGYRSLGLADAENISGVTRIRAGGSAVLFELENGEYKLFSGIVSGSCGNPYNWRNMEVFDVGMLSIVGIDTAGIVFSDGDNAAN